jgi:acyl-CoA thioester hydrolase
MFIIPTSWYVNDFLIWKGLKMQSKPIFQTQVAVRWGDMDAYQHVNNAMYLRYMEEARIQLLHKMGIKLNGRGFGPVIINASSTFLVPLTYPDNVTIDCYLAEPGRSSFMSYYKLYSQSMENKFVCEGSAKIVWIDTQTNLSVALPSEIIMMIKKQTLE